MPPPASLLLMTAFEKQVFSGETAYFALFSDDIFMHVTLRGVAALAQCIVPKTFRERFVFISELRTKDCLLSL